MGLYFFTIQYKKQIFNKYKESYTIIASALVISSMHLSMSD